MGAWCAKKLREGGPRALVDYQSKRNATSIDGLPAVDAASLVAPPDRPDEVC